MKLLDRLVYKDLLPMFFVGVLLFFSLWFAAEPIVNAGRYAAQGVPLPIIIRLVSLSVPQILGLTLPMGVLLAMLIGFGRLSADSEAVALFASGIPFGRIAAPAAVLGLVASLAGYVINDHVASSANRQLAELRTSALKQQGETTNPFNFESRKNGVLEFTVHVEKGFDIQAKEMRRVTITKFDTKTGAATVTLYAVSARWLGGTNWFLHDVTSLGGGGFYGRARDLKSYDLQKTPDNVAFLQRSPETLTFAQLRQQIDELKAGGQDNSADVRNAEVGLWSKIALPFAALVFAAIGAPLGLRPQRTSKQTGYFLSILIIFCYYVLYTVLTSIARGGGMPPALAAWLPNLLGLAVGAVLLWRASS